MLKQAKRHDLEQIVSFYQEVIEDLNRRTNFPVWRWGLHPNRQMLEQAIDKGHLVLFDSPSRLSEAETFKNGFTGMDYPFVGALIVNREDIDCIRVPWHTDSFLAIHLFAIHPALSRRHLADELIEELADAARDLNVEALRLDVVENNLPAYSLYMRHGFNELCELETAVENNETLVFDYMERLL